MCKGYVRTMLWTICSYIYVVPLQVVTVYVNFNVVRGDHHTAGTDSCWSSLTCQGDSECPPWPELALTQWSSPCKNGLVFVEKAGCVRCAPYLYVWYVFPVRKGRDWNHRGNPAPLSGIKLHCREKTSHDGNKTRQQWSQSQCKNGLAVRIRQGVCGALPYLCVWRVFSVRKGRDWNHRGNPAPLSGEKLARWEQNSPDENKTRQQRSQSQCKNGLVVEDKAMCPKRQGLKSPPESRYVL